MEFHKGCPACEHTDAELERELAALAQLIVDAYFAGQFEDLERNPRHDVDISR
jgi:hypothetical protein